jgi:hypothetical protein
MGALYLPLLLSVLALFVSIFSFFYFKFYLKARTGQERILAEFREEVDRILKSINETTDRDISLIEEREKNLKSLLCETEKRLKLYIRELEGRQEADNAYAALAKQEKKPAATYEELGKSRYRENAEDNSAKTDLEPKSAPPPVSSVAEQIRSLLRSGLPAAGIASRLGISIAEVEFAAALLERRDTHVMPQNII